MFTIYEAIKNRDEILVQIRQIMTSVPPYICYLK